MQQERQSAGVTGAYVIVTCLFFAWGFITSLVDPLVAAVKGIFQLSDVEAQLSASAFFIAYGVMSLPGAVLLSRMKSVPTVLISLALMVAGCLIMLLAANIAIYEVVLLGLFVLASGITVLQVAANPLSAALGPNGANRNGALSDLVDVGAANLKGNGEQLHQTLTGLSQAVKTLADNRDDLFDSLDNLQTFTSALAQIDAQVDRFNQNLAAVAAQLADERQALASAINLLTKALGDVATFVQQNTALLTTNVDKLADVTLTLAQERNSLAQVLDVAPAALENLSHAYNPDYGTLDTRDDSLGSTNVEVLVCEVLQQTGRLQLSGVDLSDLTALLKLPQTDQVCARLLSGDANNDGKLDDLNHNGVPDLQELLTKLFGSGGGGAPSSSSLPGLPPVGGTP